MQQQVEDTERDEIFARLKTTLENNKCFDCDKKNPKWSSVYLGLYLCLDCAGKHREYGPQISFARSLNLDTWNRRYITFMEQGGNPKALEYFKKHGLKAPYDYKNPIVQKYKQELTKKVDAVLGSAKQEENPAKPVFVSKVEEEKPQSEHGDMMSNVLTTKSFSDKPTHGEKATDDPFLGNIMINKGQTKTKGFTVEFNKGKTNFAPSKGRIAAKKIDNVDIDSLSLHEDTTYKKDYGMSGGMTDSAFGMSGTGQSNVKEVVTKSNSPYVGGEQSNEEKFKKFQNAKAISSDAFRNDNKGFDSGNARKFQNATAISSAQFFGEKEEEPQEEGIDYYQAAENVKEIFSNIGGKLKEKTSGFVNKLKDEWQ